MKNQWDILFECSSHWFFFMECCFAPTWNKTIILLLNVFFHDPEAWVRYTPNKLAVAIKIVWRLACMWPFFQLKTQHNISQNSSCCTFFSYFLFSSPSISSLELLPWSTLALQHFFVSSNVVFIQGTLSLFIFIELCVCSTHLSQRLEN